MRDIKFRAWDKELGFFVDQITYFIGLDGSVWFNNCGDGRDFMIDQSEKLVVEQYTGIKDVNDKEIYEGDILEFDRREWGGDDNIFVVSWNDKDGEWFCGGGLNSECSKWKKVIGNIHENPDLIPDDASI